MNTEASSKSRTPRPFKQRTRCGSWSIFERRFRPIDSPDLTVWWRHEQLPVNVDPHLV